MMERHTLEVEFEGELVGGCTWGEAGIDYTLYRVPGDAYVVLVTKPEGSCLVTNGGEGFTGEQIRRFFPHVAEATGVGPATIFVLTP
jgi:hypothetical protein